MVSDSFPLKEVDGTVYEVDCTMVEISMEPIGEFCRRCHPCDIQEAIHRVYLLDYN